ncbi:Fic/DOC family protein [Trinickia symbiotica]|uniref:Cell filamentation protein Fic n=1 Tax=Trinickia symbiotica TaxID=863227 RepID=A0A2N7XAM1_9BURK|nr:Fic family protein [Trinickia symbiotica]PMS38505.1 cell filamentation protein Fic [Trinickia symbiotica]PPK46485.1 Fic/DOC family protein [Trinickia symbiotica]
MSEKWLGYRWLAHRYGIAPVQPFPVESCIGPTRKSSRLDGMVRETYTYANPPADTLATHVTFALKHEGVFLEHLSRLFEAIPRQALIDWVLDERTGQYARRAGFLYEWLTGDTLEVVPDVTAGAYIDVLDPNTYLVSQAPINNARWRVRDNLPGTRSFCPTVRRTEVVRKAEQYDIPSQIEALQAEYGVDTLRRSAVWLTLKESRASFEIEHEQDRGDRVKRFAAVMEARTGTYESPLARDALTELQREILGNVTTLTSFGVRRSPVFVGSVDRFTNVLHYVAPHWADVEGMLSGLETFETRTRGAAPIARAATVAFGFVYVHPFADGNGRLHRFLINDILRRDNAVPRPFILPVSATITSKPQALAAYDQVLEVFSKPFMQRYGSMAAFEERRKYEDGVTSDLKFAAYKDAAHAWRYPDLTAHVEYLADIVDKTIRFEMREEAALLRRWENARLAVKEVIEGPNQDIDRIIRSVRDNHGSISNKLRRDFPVLEDSGLADQIAAAIERAFGVDTLGSTGAGIGDESA